MAASARPLRDAPPSKRTPAHAVRRRASHPPPPAVVRRRRALAVTAVVVLLALPFLLLLGGGGSTDAGRVAALLRQGTADPAALCEHLSAGMSRAVGGRGACVRSSPKKGPNGTVHAVHVSGATATATVTSAGGDEHVRLVRQGGDWKIDDIR
jgi:hypothetical protein